MVLLQMATSARVSVDPPWAPASSSKLVSSKDEWWAWLKILTSLNRSFANGKRLAFLGIFGSFHAGSPSSVKIWWRLQNLWLAHTLHTFWLGILQYFSAQVELRIQNTPKLITICFDASRVELILFRTVIAAISIIPLTPSDGLLPGQAWAWAARAIWI